MGIPGWIFPWSRFFSFFLFFFPRNDAANLLNGPVLVPATAAPKLFQLFQACRGLGAQPPGLSRARLRRGRGSPRAAGAAARPAVGSTAAPRMELLNIYGRCWSRVGKMAAGSGRGGDTHTHTRLCSLPEAHLAPRSSAHCGAANRHLLPAEGSCPAQSLLLGGLRAVSPAPLCPQDVLSPLSCPGAMSFWGPRVVSAGPPLGGRVAEVGMTPGSGEGRRRRRRRHNEQNNGRVCTRHGVFPPAGCPLPSPGAHPSPLFSPILVIRSLRGLRGCRIRPHSPPHSLPPSSRELVQIRKRGRACVCVCVCDR